MSNWQEVDRYLNTLGVRIGPPRLSQTTGGTHAAGSYHDKGWARDYGDADSDCRAVANAVRPFCGPNGVVELFYAPMNLWLKNGQQLSRSAIGDHDDHVHVAINGNLFLFPIIRPPGPPPPPPGPPKALLAVVIGNQ